MKIQKISFENYKVYYGHNSINFSLEDSSKNISIISGNNGYGKTSFLTALIWCLYGKLMVEVDGKYKSEVLSAGGYINYCNNSFNKAGYRENQKKVRELETELETINLTKSERLNIRNEINLLSSFGVSIDLKDVLLPSFPCNSIQVTRSFNVQSGKDTVEILIDGDSNELSKEVGPDIFINDFILPIEIAKFFFFDAEKIVSLAETRTLEEKRSLSKAYSEVLGIKKYEDLKTNLENLSTRLKKKNAKGVNKNVFDSLLKSNTNLERTIEHTKDKIVDLEEELSLMKAKSDRLQEKLIREGSSMTLEELKRLKRTKVELTTTNEELKSRVNELVDLAPFALAHKLIAKTRAQLKSERGQKNSTISAEFLEGKRKSIFNSINLLGSKNGINKSIIKQLKEIVASNLEPETPKDIKVILDYSQAQENQFDAVDSNLKGNFKGILERISKEFKFNNNELNRVAQKLRKAESKENDNVVKEIRLDKTEVDMLISEKESELIELKANEISLNNELNVVLKQLSEHKKQLRVEDQVKHKNDVASRLVDQLNDFIINLKIQKKSTLEMRLKRELNKIMHKSNFVHGVNVLIEGDLIDFELVDEHGELIKLESLSKGEQQLFATALLKSLVDESSIKFPVFIDSPLQKLDKIHARNVIKDFYPTVSEQVILLPLLEKELAEEEYNSLKPRVSNMFLIRNIENKGSFFESVELKNAFTQNLMKSTHV